MSALPADLAAAVERWLAIDPDPVTRVELEELAAAGDVDGLRSRFDGRLAFGTAGLRAELGAGPLRMNRVVVRQTTAGLLRWLADRTDGEPLVAVGFDARVNSDVFAQDVAGVVAAADGRVVVMPRPLPTPLLAYAVRHLEADAGVMVTASHNPPADNGYKVYLGDGAQLVPPNDAEIAAAIAAVADEGSPVEVAPFDHEAITAADQRLVDAYVVHTAALARGTHRKVRAVHTALHGVGTELVRATMMAAGFDPPIPVADQAEPDGAFPTVTFPNPEEPGALDLALAEARRVGADVVLANDPDTDRLGVAVPLGGRAAPADGSAADGSASSRSSGGDVAWRALTGDEIGVLLADHTLRHTDGDDRLVASTIVSSRLLGLIAAGAGVHHATTLTGFKWIIRPALAHPEWRFVFGYEEALGYLVGDVVRDKDGVGAAVCFAELVAELAAAGMTVQDRLDELARRHGLHATDQVSIRFGDRASGLPRMRDTMDRVRAAPPAELAGVAVVHVTDLQDGTEELPPADVVLLELDGGGRVALRPSGTEPKLKAYLEVVVAVGDEPAAAADARGAARTQLDGLRDAVTDLLDG
ncbi:MAG: phospho-sugar mutase [Actinomycetota bacterium]|nr:phospho-sugar mutase [Actinomycetota bacterium]